MERFINRKDAGQQLAKACASYAGVDNGIVLALPRGGVPVAYEVAKALHLPLDVYIVRKIGMPGNEEFAIAAIASGHILVKNEESLLHSLNEKTVKQVIERETRELHRREQLYRQNKKPLVLKNKVVILIDDGIATGSTLKAAIQSIKLQKPEKIIVAVPVAEKDSLKAVCRLVDECICLLTPYAFYAVGTWYEHFNQTEDEEVISLLKQQVACNDD